MCVHADASVQAYGQPRHTLTAEGALRVDTAAVHTHPRSLTLIDVYTEASGWVQQVPRLTNALEAALLIDTHAIQTHIPDQAFVLVLAVLPIG